VSCDHIKVSTLGCGHSNLGSNLSHDIVGTKDRSQAGDTQLSGKGLA
jgi:hypothetical protein